MNDKNKYEGKPKNIFLKIENGNIIETVKTYDDLLEGFTKLDVKNKKSVLEYEKHLNKKTKLKNRPNYDYEKMWDILEQEIPALKKYRKSVREAK